MYVETFPASVYPTTEGPLIAIVPENSPLPPPEARPLDSLRQLLPPNSLVYRRDQLPKGPRQGTYQTYSQVMSMWESLHAPFLAAADAEPDPIKKIHAYRRTIGVDYACELAHQKLS